MKKYILILLLGTNCMGADVQVCPYVDLDVIAQIESSGNPKAVGDGGKSLGKFQVKAKTVECYNKYYHTKLKHTDAFDPNIGRKIAHFYFYVEIPKYLRNKKIPITRNSMIECYNRGPSRVGKLPLPKVTQDYIKKYEKLTKNSI